MCPSTTMFAQVFPVAVRPDVSHRQRMQAFKLTDEQLAPIDALYQTMIRLAGTEPRSVEVGERKHIQVLGQLDGKINIPQDSVYYDEHCIAANNRVCLRLFLNCLLGLTFRANPGDKVKYAYRVRLGAWRHGQATVTFDAGLYFMCKNSYGADTQPVPVENVIEVRHARS